MTNFMSISFACVFRIKPTYMLLEPHQIWKISKVIAFYAVNKLHFF